MEVTKNRVRQFHLSLALADHQGQVPNLELTRLIGLEHLSLRVNLDVFVLNGELRAIDFDLLVSRVLNDNAVGHTFTDWAGQVNRLNFRVVLNSDCKGVELILTRVLSLECAREFVSACSKCKEVKFVVFVTLASNIEGVGTSDEQTGLLLSFNLPIGTVSLSLLGPVLDLDDQVLSLLSRDGLSDGAFGLGGSRHTIQVVQEGRTIGQGEE